MKRFRNILVGVDLSLADRLVADELAPPSAEAVACALWLAKINAAESAKIRFFSTLDVSPRTQHVIERRTGNEPNLLDRAAGALQKLVDRARAEGVEADSEVVFGNSWLQIIRCVLREGHDLVVAGTRHMGRAECFLLGSTGIKLLRKCPCPVWIAQPQAESKIAEILVAHDLRPVGDLAMELGCWLAQHHDAQLHVLHSVEYPQLDFLDNLLPESAFSEEETQYRETAEQHIAAQLATFELSRPAHVQIVSEPPDVAILNYLEQHSIQLLVMGTIGRAGIAGMFTGNTTERMLPRIGCSVLAVKPEGFESPVLLE
jgi:universal stress protein E